MGKVDTRRRFHITGGKGTLGAVKIRQKPCAIVKKKYSGIKVWEPWVLIPAGLLGQLTHLLKPTALSPVDIR